MKTTDWFPIDVNPVRIGVYQQPSGFGQSIGYQNWSGRFWGLWGETKDEALRLRGVKAKKTPYDK